MDKIAIIGLGYIGLPLARLFATQYPVIGFDVNVKRVKELQEGVDKTLEVEGELLTSVLVKNHCGLDPDSSISKGLLISSEEKDISNCNIYIIAVPTPVDKYNVPDLMALCAASETVARVLRKDDIVILESTVYPGVTEEVCMPIIERISGLRFNHDFYAGYTPERVNPGDKFHTVEKVKKVISGSTPGIASKINELYSSVIEAGTHVAPAIKVAEAAKVIENAQRDINIAFVNELAKIFNRLDIDTSDVLEAAGTKWNFLHFKPGLVGGHCIGVDPYYLSQKAREAGYNPEIILAGRRMNDGMGEYVATEFVKLMIKKGLQLVNAEILILGFTFKENCPDVRNTKVIDIVHILSSYHPSIKITIYDPWANKEEVTNEYGTDINMVDKLPQTAFDGIILAVAHQIFEKIDYCAVKKADGVLYDVKSVLDRSLIDGRL